MQKPAVKYFILGLIILLAVTAIIIAWRLYALRNEPVAPTAPKSRPAAADNPNPSAACTLTFTLSTQPTSTPGPTNTPGPTSTPGPTATPAPNPGCGDTCDVNNNKCPSDAPYCIDFEGDNKGYICGRQQIAGQGPKCEKPKPGCGEACDVNNNQCSSDSRYCVDYAGDNKGAICGKQPLAGEGPQCNPQPTPTPAPQLPAAGISDKTVWGVIGGAALVVLGFLSL